MAKANVTALDEDYNWHEVFKYADGRDSTPTAVQFGSAVSTDPCLLKDVVEVVSYEDGDNDGPDWVGVFKMNDGRYLAVRAGCDYTGWG